jgi:hypothetical protein
MYDLDPHGEQAQTGIVNRLGPLEAAQGRRSRNGRCKFRPTRLNTSRVPGSAVRRTGSRERIDERSLNRKGGPKGRYPPR